MKIHTSFRTVEFGLTGREGHGSRRPIEPGASRAKGEPRFREDRLPGRGRVLAGLPRADPAGIYLDGGMGMGDSL